MGTGWRRLQVVAVSGSAGEGLLLTALPLMAVTITTDPRQVALVNVVGQLPWLLFSLVAGVLIDRFQRTAVLGAAFGVQAVAAAVLAVAASAGWLGLPLLLVVSFVVVTSQVLGDGASGALVPDVVGPERLAAANARMIVIDRGVVQFVVPPVTGFLLAYAVGLPAWIACVTALVALWLTRGITARHVPNPPGHPLRDIKVGLAFLVGSPLLRTITLTVALGSFAASACVSMFVLYATQVLHVGSFGYGVLLAFLAVGWIGASFVVHRVVVRLGYAWSMRLATIGGAVAQLLIAVLPPVFALVAVALVLLSSTTLVWNVCSQSSRQQFTPKPLLGRVLTSHRALAWGLTPLGALTGGFVAAQWGLRWVWVMGAAIQLLSVLLMWRTVSPKGFAVEEARAVV
ncbi:MFS transporter [Umezawaea sp. Da 62-37]|uniref:MFS transporter n=1 Tax=Umezawaea sp. Da 62-37 TaxID=3075927 RepID=UPI0028F70B70|nr:MFS transporter [Umezawaea sp. Da 62-37]WNV89319.1 MFS transporter [Umezawaea sp. Da 62-37]